MSSSKFQILSKIISQRKAIRQYNSQKIPQEIIHEVICLACRAPSWYGLEPWYILVIENKKIHQELYPFTNNQLQIINCSHLFLLLSYKGEAFNWETELFKEKVLWKFNRLTEENYFNFIKDSLKNFEPNNCSWISNWAKQQVFILLQNFLLLFTSLEIATSPMGGFQEKKIIDYLEKNNLIQPNTYNLAVIFATGYPSSEKEWEKSVLAWKGEKLYKLI